MKKRYIWKEISIGCWILFPHQFVPFSHWVKKFPSEQGLFSLPLPCMQPVGPVVRLLTCSIVNEHASLEYSERAGEQMNKQANKQLNRNKMTELRRDWFRDLQYLSNFYYACPLNTTHSCTRALFCEATLNHLNNLVMIKEIRVFGLRPKGDKVL